MDLAHSDKTQTSTITFAIVQPLLRGFIYGLDTMQERANIFLEYAASWTNLQQTSSLILDTVNNYWNFSAGKKLLKVRVESEKGIFQILKFTEKLINQGLLAREDINQTLAEFENQKINRFLAEQNLLDAFQNLKFSMGITEEVDFRIDKVINVEDFPEVDMPLESLFQLYENYISYALENRYDILASKNIEDAADAILKGAYNNELPQLDILGSMFIDNFNLSHNAESLFNSYGASRPEHDYKIGVHISTPFFNDAAIGFRRQANAQLAQTTHQLRGNSCSRRYGIFVNLCLTKSN